MKRIRLSIVFLALLVFVAGCSGDVSTSTIKNLGTISGKALYTSSSSSAGICVTAELIENGGTTTEVAAQSLTDADGNYSLSDLKAGDYTIYASSDSSKEKAITTNVRAIARETVTASTLHLTPTGSISGTAVIDEKETNIAGYTIFIPGTSYSAITDSYGAFTISDIPVSSYVLMIMKNGNSGYFSRAEVTSGSTTSLGSISINSSKLGLNNSLLVWKGNQSSSPLNPEENWAYYNTTDGCSYIYANGSWSTLARGGNSINWIGSYSSSPTSPHLYDAYYNTSDGNSYIYDGTSWTILASRGSQGDRGATGAKGLDGTSIEWKGAFDEAPKNAEELWAYYNTTDGCSYIYHNGEWGFLATAGLSIEWLGSFDAEPTEYRLYSAYFNNLTGCSYIYDGEKWTLLAAKGDAGQEGESGQAGKDGADGKSIIWKGSYASKEDLKDPQELWAFYNTSNGCSYIYSKGIWTLLASSSSMDSEMTMIIGYVNPENRASKAGIFVTATSISTTDLIYKTYTNDSGYFAFSCLSVGEYLISVTADGYISSTLNSINVESGKTADAGTIELKLERGTVTGKVNLDATDDYSGVKVSILGTDYSALTDTNGFYTISLLLGTYGGGISFEKKNYKATVVEESFVVKKDQQTNIAEISLNATRADYVTGTVKIKGLNDNSGVTIKLSGAEDYTTKTDSSGSWSIENVLIGSYSFTALKDGVSEFKKDVEVGIKRIANLGTITFEQIIVSDPVFNYQSGTYQNDVSLSITADSGAVVYYTIDGTVPSAKSLKYDSPIAIDKTTTIKAIAIKDKLSSNVISADFILKVGDITATVSAGYYKEAKSVGLSSGSLGATIYYTLNGSTPTKTSSQYTSPINLKNDTVIKAIAYKGEYDASALFEAEYTFNKPDTPTFSIGAGTYSEGRGIVITSSSDADIYYTIDGSVPTSSSKEYTSEIALEKNMTLKAIAYRGGLNTEVVSAVYKVKTATPEASVDSGTYKEKQSVTLTTSSSGATIYYTTNGKAPTTASSIYKNPILIEKNTEIKAIAVKNGLLSSDTSTYSYIIDNQSGNITIEDPIFRELEIISSNGNSSGMSINNDSLDSIELSAKLTPTSSSATYKWYIDGNYIFAGSSICLGSYLDYLVVGSHIIRAEAVVKDDTYVDNFLLKITN